MRQIERGGHFNDSARSQSLYSPKLSPLVTARRGKNLIQRCLSDDPTNALGKDYPEPRLRQYMAPKGVIPSNSIDSKPRQQRAVSQPRRLPPPQPLHVTDEQPTADPEDSASRTLKRRRTRENMRSPPQEHAPMPMPPPLARQPSPSFSRGVAAASMLSEYCMFAGQRYQHHFDPELPAIEGTFFIQFVAESYVIFDELQFSKAIFFLV